MPPSASAKPPIQTAHRVPNRSSSVIAGGLTGTCGGESGGAAVGGACGSGKGVAGCEPAPMASALAGASSKTGAGTEDAPGVAPGLAKLGGGATVVLSI